MEDARESSAGACVLVSGGIESMVLLQDALARHVKVVPLYLKNHLRWEEVELFWLKKFLRNIKSDKLKPLAIIELNMRDVYEGHWSLTGIKVPSSNSKDQAVYLPGRNILFFAKAAVFMAQQDLSVLEIGILKGNPFSDSTPAFLRKMSDVLSMGLEKKLFIQAPFHKLKKEEVVLMGKKLPLEFTFSCINPKGYEHCGGCNKCTERKKAFFTAGLLDKTKYKKSGI
jgi:7-cyano-7-deazaguanine synthase